MDIEKLKSAIYNNVVSGAKLGTINDSFSLEQIEDSIINEWYSLIKEYSLKGLLPVKDLVLSMNCIPVDCSDIDRCCNSDKGIPRDLVKHIEIPQIVNDFGAQAVTYLGTTDRSLAYEVYTDMGWMNHKFRRRGANKPYAWIDTSPNANGRYDAFIINASPLLEEVSLVAVFKDPRQVEEMNCCSTVTPNVTFLTSEIEKRVTEKFIRYYRQMATAVTPNDQTVK